MNTIAVIAPHPDDETLGCGGTLLAHKNQGDSLYWIIATCLEKNPSFSDRAAQRDKEIQRITETYGFKKTYRAEFPTASLDQISTTSLIEKLKGFLKEIQPTTLYVPYPHDVHTDHRAVFEATMSASKWFRLPSLKRILAYETLSETDFAPFFTSPAFSANYYVDISKHLEKKIEIMKQYEGELGTHPFPRSPESIRALATLRGAQSGLTAAEAFLLVREISSL